MPRLRLRRSVMSTVRLFGFAATSFAAILSTAAAQNVDVIPEVNHGISIPVRLMPYEQSSVTTVRPRPQIPPASASAVDTEQEDPVLQEITGPLVATTPGLNILGVGNGFTGPNGAFVVTSAPPDTNAAVGAT